MKRTEVALCLGDLALVEGGDPPSEFRLFAPGPNPTTKGDILFDEKAAVLVMAEYRRRRRKRLMGDWEHAYIAGSQDPTKVAAGGVPASLWFTPEVRQTADGPELWATDVKFTPTAFEQVKRGEYAHFSPAVNFDPSTGRVTRLINVALTNEPATIGQEQLVAASDNPTPEMPVMKLPEKYAGPLKGLMDGDYADEGAVVAALKKCLGDLFGSKEPDGDEAKAALCALSGKTVVAEGVAVLSAWRDASAQVKALSDELATLRADKVKGEVANLLERARTAGKLAPAVLSDAASAEPQTSPGKFVARCKAEGDIATLSAYIDALPVLVGQPHTVPPVEPGAIVVLTDTDRAIAKQLGLSEAQALAAKQRALATA